MPVSPPLRSPGKFLKSKGEGATPVTVAGIALSLLRCCRHFTWTNKAVSTMRIHTALILKAELRMVVLRTVHVIHNCMDNCYTIEVDNSYSCYTYADCCTDAYYDWHRNKSCNRCCGCTLPRSNHTRQQEKTIKRISNFSSAISCIPIRFWV